MNGPCKGCPDRAATCHDTCEKYIQWRDKMRAANNANREDRKHEYTVRKTIWNAVEQSRRGRGKKWTNS